MSPSGVKGWSPGQCGVGPGVLCTRPGWALVGECVCPGTLSFWLSLHLPDRTPIPLVQKQGTVNFGLTVGQRKKLFFAFKILPGGVIIK